MTETAKNRGLPIAAMSGGFKWIELGRHDVIADETGRILAYIIRDAPAAPRCPILAFVGIKEIGRYIDAESARLAIEEHMSISRRTANFNSGRVPDLLPMDERAWLEDQP